MRGFKSILVASAFAASCLFGSAQAAEPIVIPNVIELSGNGATVGANWKDAIEMAADEINNDGGILGRQVKLKFYDTQSKPGVARSQMIKVVENNPYVVMGPIYSSSTRVAMLVTEKAQIPDFVGSESTILTEQGNPYIFRTGFGEATSMAQLGRYLDQTLGVKSVALLWSNTAYGKGGRDGLVKYLKAHDIKIATDISAEVGQLGYSTAISKIASSDADIAFVFLLQEESARFLKQAKKKGLDVPVIGGTTLAGPEVIALAGKAANGARGIVGLEPGLPVKNMQEMAKRFEKRYGHEPSHDAYKGYIALYTVKAITERMGEFNSKRFAKELHGAIITPKEVPGILTPTAWDDAGDVYRKSYIIQVVDGKQKVVDTVPLPPILSGQAN